MSSKDNQNVWFGIAMFLIGLVSGATLIFFSGMTPGSARKDVAAPTAQQAPKVSAKERISTIAADIGLDVEKFESCIANNTYTEKINAQMSAGQAAGVSGTPGNIVYHIKSKKAVLVSGAQPFEAFKAVIDQMLKDPKGVTGEEAKNVTPVDFDTDHVRGDSSAKIAVIEYSDYECPFCQRVHPTYQKIIDSYGSDVAWVFRHFPLSFHADAMPIAIGAECAAEVGGKEAFWTYTDAFFQ